MSNNLFTIQYVSKRSHRSLDTWCAREARHGIGLPAHGRLQPGIKTKTLKLAFMTPGWVLLEVVKSALDFKVEHESFAQVVCLRVFGENGGAKLLLMLDS